MRNSPGAARAPGIAPTCQTQALLVPAADPRSPHAPHSPMLKEIFRRRRGGGEGSDRRSSGKDSRPRVTLPRQRWCSCRHNEGLIGDNTGTQREKNGSHSQLRNAQRHHSTAEAASLLPCVRACALASIHVHHIPGGKPKRHLFLSSENCTTSRR